MKKTSLSLFQIVASMIVLVALAAFALTHRFWGRHAPAVLQAETLTHPTSPATTVASTRAADRETAKTYLDVLRRRYPEFPVTQPLSIPLELSQAAHLVLDDPIYLAGAPRSEMWITRSDALATEQVLKEAVHDDQDVHVIRERVVFVHWMPADTGPWKPFLVCRRGDGTYEIVSEAHGRQALPVDRGYHWEHAFSWNQQVVAPTGHGVSIFRFGASVKEGYHDLAQHDDLPATGFQLSEPRVLLDNEGLICWLPWEPGKIGGVGAARYTPPRAEDDAASPDGKWTDLTPADGWPARILHLVPLLDGSVLMLAMDEQGAISLQFNTLEHSTVNPEAIAALVDQLSDTDEHVRNHAYDTLSQYGSGAWPILEKLMNDQGPEAQARLRQLLKQRVTPTLNGMTLLGKKSLKLAARLADGGTVFFAEGGVSIPNPDQPDAGPDYRVPAWIALRPGYPIELLPAALTADLTPGRSKLYVNGNDWIVSSDARGPRRFVGNGFVTLLRKSEQSFSDFVGEDRRGRWLFRKPRQADNVAIAPATMESTTTLTSQPTEEPSTLIIDPSLPDPTPRLPVWVFNTADVVGWTRDDWPVAKKLAAYALHADDWQLVDAKERLYTDPADVPPPTEPGPTTSATTRASVATTESSDIWPASAPASRPGEDHPILTDRDGRRYFGGLTDLRIISRAGAQQRWTLPPIANGQGPVWLIRRSDGRLFLFNQPGRVVRIKPTPGGADPFVVEKIFTHRIPTVDHPTRIWLDPAGRIIMAWGNQLAIFFPDGYIPPAIADKMTPEGNDDDEE